MILAVKLLLTTSLMVLLTTTVVTGQPTSADLDNPSITSGVPVADLSIAKVDDVDPIIAGNTLTYTVTVTNLSMDSAGNVVVTDTLPAGVTFVSTSGDCSNPTGVPTCNLGSIAGGAAKMYTVTVTVDAATVGTITNQVSVASDHDTNAGNDSASEDTVVEAPVNGSIAVTKTANPMTTTGGSTVTFTNGVENTTGGNATAGDSAVTNATSDFILTSLVDSVFGDLNGQGTCSVPQTIPAGQTYTCTFTGTVNNQGGNQHASMVTAMGNFGTPLVTRTGMATVTVTITPPVPTMGEWGLILLALLLTTMGVMSMRRRRRYS